MVFNGRCSELQTAAQEILQRLSSAIISAEAGGKKAQWLRTQRNKIQKMVDNSAVFQWLADQPTIFGSYRSSVILGKLLTPQLGKENGGDL